MGMKQFFLTLLAVIVALFLYHLLKAYLPTIKKTGTTTANATATSAANAASNGDSVLAYLNQNS